MEIANMTETKRRTLICDCKEMPTRSEKAAHLKGCKCRTAGRKERDFDSVIVEVS